MAEHNSALIAIKAVSMVIMFTLIMVTGNLPLRWERFRKSAKLISLASAFAGGLFISVGVLHLLPEAREAFDNYYASVDKDPDEEFPWPNFICVVCFAFVLFIEKVAFASYMGHDENEGHDHHGGGQDHEHAHIPIMPHKVKEENPSLYLTQNPSASLIQESTEVYHEMTGDLDDDDDAMQRMAQKKASITYKIAQQAKKSSLLKKSMIHGEHKISQLTPYILQIAIGIHATFEGMAIGIEQEVSSCIGIALAVVCHKWAEGLTLGIAFFKAGVDLKMSTIMIAIQGVMNPLGIMIGWILSDQGYVIRGVFQSISAGTFLYIAAGEVIVNEFNLKRNRFLKYFLFLLAIGFVTSLFFIEQVTGG